MRQRETRRGFLAAVGTTVATAATADAAFASSEDPIERPKLRVLGISCSPRKGKTTAKSLEVALEAAAAADGSIETELIELADRDIPVFVPGSNRTGDFPEVAAKLTAPGVAGILIGTPVYFGSPTSLCKAFLDHCSVFRRQNFALANKVAGVLAVGGVRNGGQELTIQCVQTALFCHEMIVVGDGRPTAHFGATLLNSSDDVSGDEFGLTTARGLGTRVARVAIQMRRNAGD